MKKKIPLSFISICCVIAIVFSLNSIFAQAEDNINPLNKISASLIEKMESGLDSDRHNVILWLNDIEHDQIENQVSYTKEKVLKMKEKGNYSSELAEVTSSGDSLQTLDEIQVEIEISRKIYSESYLQNNQSIYNLLISNFKKGGVPLANEESSPTSEWYSEYAPIVKTSLTKSQIWSIAQNKLVDYIYDGDLIIEYADEFEQDYNLKAENTKALLRGSSPSVWQRTTNSDINRDTYGYDGSGVKVGLLDTGVLRWSELTTEEKSVFSAIYNDGRLIADPNVPSGNSPSHAAYCGSVIVSGLSSNKGLAPEVTLYSSCSNRTGGAEGSFEWLISKGVNVISCSVSWSSTSTACTYDYLARYIDHIYVHHDTTIVLCGGNQSAHNTLGTPASSMSYNAIVVGSTNDMGTASRSDDTYASHSCYSQNALLAAKPDVAAPGELIITPFGETSGTSLATPQVAAIVAQLFTQRPALKTGQTLSKAIIMASIGSYGGSSQIKSVAGTNSPALHPRLGAGEVDAAGVRFIAKNYRYVNTTFTSSTNVYTKTFTVSSSDTLMNVALVWQKNNRMTGSHTSYNDPANPQCPVLTLEVIAPNGTKFISARPHGNVQMLTFVPVGTGTYTIRVTKVSAPSTEPTVTFALAWR